EECACLVQRGGVVAGIVYRSEGRAVGETLARDQVPPAYDDGVETQFACDQVDHALDDVCRLGPAGAPVGAGGDFVRRGAHDVDVGGGKIVPPREQICDPG